jgi:hypothetical protein
MVIPAEAEVWSMLKELIPVLLENMAPRRFGTLRKRSKTVTS